MPFSVLIITKAFYVSCAANCVHAFVLAQLYIQHPKSIHITSIATSLLMSERKNSLTEIVPSHTWTHAESFTLEGNGILSMNKMQFITWS